MDNKGKDETSLKWKIELSILWVLFFIWSIIWWVLVSEIVEKKEEKKEEIKKNYSNAIATVFFITSMIIFACAIYVL